MPPRRPIKPMIARPRGSDPTVSIATASAARTAINTQQPQNEEQKQPQQQKANDDLKKLIETLKNKIGTVAGAPTQKQTPPQPKARGTWNRSIEGKDKAWTAKPAYTILTRVSDHEKVPLKSVKQKELTISALPHSFLYRPGIDGIKIDKVTVKSGRQVGMG